jgi:hypothetical protein
MEIAELVLEYLDVLAWPVVIGAVLFAFRTQIAEKIASLAKASTPIGVLSFWDRSAQKVEKEADEALAESSPPSSSASEKAGPDDPEGPWFVEPPTGRHWYVLAAATVLQGADFSTAREIATVDPNASVMTAYREVEKVARAALVVHNMEPVRGRALRTIVKELTGGSVGPEFGGIAHDLASLRNDVTHGASDVTTTGALSFIGACDALAAALASAAASKVRHPSRREFLTRALTDEEVADDENAHAPG